MNWRQGRAYEQDLRDKMFPAIDAGVAAGGGGGGVSHGVSVSHAVMWEELQELNLTLKRKTRHAAEQEPSDVATAHQEWRALQAP
jgi:hypothetical protein